MIDTAKLLNETNIVDIISQHVHLEKRGSEYTGKCPFHDDEKASLNVNESKQIFKCFACGGPNGKGGDSIHFLMGLGMEFNDACKSIANGDSKYDVNVEKREVKKITKPEWKQIIPSPELDQEINHFKFGKPSMVWKYHNQVGEIIGFVCRFDLDDGTKQVLPYCFATNGKMNTWRWIGFNLPRPLYNLHLFNKHPKASILIVEGEKTADAAQNELNPEKTIVTTWIGGANGIVNADFKPLHGRKLIFWPDHDKEQKYGENHPNAGEIKPWNEQPGNQAMLQVNEMIEKHCAVRRWVDVPVDFPNKWDAADKEWNDGELRDFVKTNLGDVPKIVEPIAKAVQQEMEVTAQPSLPIVVPPSKPPMKIVVDSMTENEHFKMLGYDKDENGRLVYYFFSFEFKTTIKLTPSSISKSNLMMIAPINWWEDKFPGNKTKVDVDAAQQFLTSYSARVGMFKEKFIRGRGAWVDNDRFVIHTGDELIVDEQKVHLRGIDSKYVYEIGEKIGLGGQTKLSNKDASLLIDKMKWLKWEREINAYLITGWCVIAPLCGVLNWRPHVWVTGPAGSGKSWIMDKVVKKLLGEAAIVVQGKTTEAGVRGLLQNDARAVLFDESDVDSHNDKERIQNILSLARSASYSDGGVIGKGTQSGASRTYTMRSCFAFSSIGVQLNQQSDRSRFTMLGLMSFENHRTKDDFVKFEHEWNNLVDDDYAHKLQARSIHLLPIILKNASTFADAVSAVIGQRRIGDQVGAMLAGAYSLTSTSEISYDDAVQWVSNKDWDEEKSLELTKDEYQLFTKIMGHPITIETQHSRIERTIGETILISTGQINEIDLSRESASNRLRRLGIIIHENEVFISNTADGIKKIITNTAWNNNHNKILERLPGALKVEPRTYYPGCKSRGVSLPLAMISEGFETINDSPMVDDNDLPF
jgi:putative DNA primase/helicase